ncbi:MAG: thioredoxin fold domain-containing protein [Ignavibacteria bacterium]|nr:thioredoxin fold domain-containing protein [Ignavibacteria bacterium]
MRKNFSFLLFFVIIPLFAYSEEIQFETGSFSEVLLKAKSENKNVMIDFFTDWCKWCVELDKVVYTDKEVSKYANTNQINWKIDAEKGEGPELVKKYNVKGYPTIVFVDPEGKEIDRIVGFFRPGEFLQLMKDFNSGVNTYDDLKNKLEINPYNTEANFLIGKKLFDYGSAAQSKQYFEKVLNIDSDNISGYADNAKMYFALLTNDIQSLKNFNSDYPGSDVLKTVSIMVAEYYYQNNENYEEAAKQYKIAFDNYGVNDEDIRFSYGQYLLTYAYSIMRDENADKEKIELGIRLCNESFPYVEGSVNEGSLYYRLSEFYYRLDNYGEALKSIDKAISVYSNKTFTAQREKIIQKIK